VHLCFNVAIHNLERDNARIEIAKDACEARCERTRTATVRSEADSRSKSLPYSNEFRIAFTRN
jgi:hypothetical protein